MYWIYLLIFITMVFVPAVVNTKILILEEEAAEQAVIFLLGVIATLIFIFSQKKIEKNNQERKKIKKELFKTSKELADTYFYIGETNRKLDILKKIASKLAVAPHMNKKQKKKLFYAILDSIQMLAKTDKFTIRFVNVKTGVVKLELINVAHNKNIFRKIKINPRETAGVEKKGKYIFVKSGKSVSGVLAFVIINSNDRLENLDLIRILTTQAIFLFGVSQDIDQSYFNKK